MRIVDSHVNISENGKWFNTDLKCSYEHIVDALDEAKVEKAALLAMPGVCTNKFFEKKDINRDRFWIIGNIDFNDVNYSLDQIEDLKLDAVKVHPRFQNISLKSLAEQDFLKRLEANNIPLVVCGWQQSSNIPIEDLSPNIIDRIAKNYRDLKILITHMSGHRFWDAYNVSRSNKNVYLDCSYFLDFFKGSSLEKDFFNMANKLDKKILYGSDFPEIDIKSYCSHLLELGKLQIEEKKLENIIFNNAFDFFGKK